MFYQKKVLGVNVTGYCTMCRDNVECSFIGILTLTSRTSSIFTLTYLVDCRGHEFFDVVPLVDCLWWQTNCSSFTVLFLLVISSLLFPLPLSTSHLIFFQILLDISMVCYQFSLNSKSISIVNINRKASILSSYIWTLDILVDINF